MNVSISLDELTDILARESVQCDRLAHNIVQEREAIKGMALQNFITINQARISILECLQGLKEELDGVLDRLAVAHHVPGTERTFTQVLHRIHAPQAHVVLQQYERLAEKARSVTHDLAINQMLITNVQSFLVRAMEVYRQPAQEDGLYTVSGSRNTSGTSSALIRRQG